MSKRLLKKVIASLSVVALLSGVSSCSTSDDYLDEFEVRQMIEEALRENNQTLEFTNWEIVPFSVSASQWEWDEVNRRYQAIFDLDELTEFIYEKGAGLGYVFIGEQGQDEVQKTLPYVETYPIFDGEEITGTYTETISFDIQYQNNGQVAPTVAFYIQVSDLYQDDGALPDNYNFRIVLIW